MAESETFMDEVVASFWQDINHEQEVLAGYHVENGEES